MAPKFVAPYRMSGRQDKNDAADALAICETVQRQLRALCRGRNSAFFQRGISSPHDGRWGRGSLQLPRAIPISPHRAGWEWRVDQVTSMSGDANLRVETKT